MKAQGVLFLNKSRPVTEQTASGFCLRLTALDRRSKHTSEVWELFYYGDIAKSFWHAHQASLVPGQPIAIEVIHIGRHPYRPVIEATAINIILAPRSHLSEQPVEGAAP